MIIVRGLYGLKSAGFSFKAHLANTLRAMGFKPTFANCGVWMRKNFLPIPQEINNSAGSGMGTDTTAIRPAPNPSNSAPTSSTYSLSTSVPGLIIF